MRILYSRINSGDGSTNNTMDPHQPPPNDDDEVPMEHTTIKPNAASTEADGDRVTPTNPNPNTASGHFADGLGRRSGPQGPFERPQGQTTHFERPQGHSATNPTNPDPVQNA